jgi:hypothetical protein
MATKRFFVQTALIAASILAGATGSGLPLAAQTPNFLEREVGRHLARVGLPVRPARAGFGGCHPHEAGLGELLARVDWEAAVRQGARNVVVRGFSREAGRGRKSVEELTQAAVRNGVIAGLNQAAANDPTELARFQALVQQGVEDALVEAWNELGARTPGALPPAWRRHYSGPLTGEYFHDRYAGAELVEAGWILDPAAQPLTGADEFLVLTLRASPSLVEVWSGRRLVAEQCRFVRCFEDAQRVVPKQP